MTTFDTELVDRWFTGLLDPDGSADHAPWLRPEADEREVLLAGGRSIAAAVGWSELPKPVPAPSRPAAAVLQVYLAGVATGIAGARRSMAVGHEVDDESSTDRLCLVAGLIAGGAAVAVDSSADSDPEAAELAQVAGNAAAELVVDGADLHAITRAAAAAALLAGPPDAANRDPGYRARALVGSVLVGLQRASAPPGAPVRRPSCGAGPGANNGMPLLAEVTFTMFLPPDDAVGLERTLAGLSDEIVVLSDGDRRSFHVHTRSAGEVIAESYAVGSVFSLVVGRLD
ncbi:hypothetical protein [Nakamurella panacisegetis]|nr:hypothetical protein [Nakamurella panacisegetis]